VPIERSDGVTGRRSLYTRDETTAAAEEALCGHKKKRWRHQKKLFVPIGRSDGLTGKKNSLYPLELAVASPEENLSTLWGKR
jgi:hypothetical protein